MLEKVPVYHIKMTPIKIEAKILRFCWIHFSDNKKLH